MTEKEFVSAHEHELLGWVLDAMTCGLRGDLASMRLRELTHKVRGRLAMMYQQLKPAENGKPIVPLPLRKP